MKLLAADYDGTLRYQDTVTEEDINALTLWRNAGNLFVIDTGRSMESILEEVNRYKIPVDYFVTNNGGMAFDRNQKELYSSYLERIMSLDIMYIAQEIGGVVSYVVNDGFRRHRIIVDKELTEKRYPSLEPDMTFEELTAMDRYAQIVISMAEKEYAGDLAERINEHFPDAVEAYANKYVVDVVPKGISKADGLARIVKPTGIAEEDVYTVGDADNDIPLIMYGCNGYCMDMAEEHVKAHARHTCRCIAEMVRKILETE